MGQTVTTITKWETEDYTYWSTRYITRTQEHLTTTTNLATTTIIHTSSVTSTVYATETKVVTTDSPYPEWYDNTVLGLWIVGYVILLAVLGGLGFAFVGTVFLKIRDKLADREDEDCESDPLLSQPSGGYGANQQRGFNETPPRYTPTTSRTGSDQPYY